MADRGAWKSNTGFLLAAIGSAVGLGNIWRFPYVAYENGGGAFLIPYVVALLTAGIPILMLELSLGQKKKASAPMAFYKIDSKWEWLGWWSVSFIMFGVVLYYIVVISWCANYILFYVFKSWGADTNGFFFKKFLSISGGVWDLKGLNLPVVFAVFLIWFINWWITYKGIEKGIERAVKLMMPILFVLTVIMGGPYLLRVPRSVLNYTRPRISVKFGIFRSGLTPMAKSFSPFPWVLA